MRIRSLSPLTIFLAIFFTTLLPARAVVGYYNVTLPAGYSLLCNQLNAAPTNALNTVISNGTPNGSRVYLWDSTNQSFTAPATFLAGAGGWNPNYDISPGKGFMIWSSSTWTQTFIGEILTGTLTNFIAGTNQFSLLGDKIPIAGSLATNHLFPLIDSASVYVFSTATQSYLDAYSSFTNLGWFDPKGLADTNGPNINVGQGFFVQNPGPATNWSKTFTIFFAPSELPIASFAVSGEQVVLKIKNAGAPYNVQFSTDRISWQTVATNQTSGIWAGPYPSGQQGYYKIVNP